MAKVAISSVCFWLAGRKRQMRIAKPAEKEAFAGELVAAAQPAN